MNERQIAAEAPRIIWRTNAQAPVPAADRAAPVTGATSITLAAARKRWRAEGRCRDCGQPLIEDGREGGARCGSCRAGAARRRGWRRNMPLEAP